MPAADETRFESVVVADADLVEIQIKGCEYCFVAEDEMSYSRSWTIGAYNHASCNVRAIFEGGCDIRPVGVIGDILEGFIMLHYKSVRLYDKDRNLTSVACH